MLWKYIKTNQWQSVSAYQSRSILIWALYVAAILIAMLGLGFLMTRSEPDASILAWLIYILGAGAIIYQPRWGIYLIVFLALVGDASLMPWYPFVKNFSSHESIFFINDALIISPLESYILLAYVSWLGKDLVLKKFRFRTGPITYPALIFLLFIVLGTVFGVLNGGNFNIALWEVRPFFYLVAMIILATNLLEDKNHFAYLFAWAIAAIFIKSVIGVDYFYTAFGGTIAGLESLTDHAASIHINVVFVLFLGAWFINASLRKRLGLLILLPFIVITYLVSQRRAAFISLVVAVLILLIILYFQRRNVFWIVFPVISIIAVGYLGLFWNSSSALALPAQAIKSVVAPGAASAADYSSNLYRIIENINTSYTIHQRPLTGVGFGNKFLIIYPLPDISFFAWWDYFPHNSIIYIWVKAGIGAFFAMLVFIGTTIFTGVGNIARTKTTEERLLLLTGTVYVIMHFIYAYVDISWDAQSMVFLGAIIGMINISAQVLSKSIEPAKPRYPWQPEKEPEILFLPLNAE